MENLKDNFLGGKTYKSCVVAYNRHGDKEWCAEVMLYQFEKASTLEEVREQTIKKLEKMGYAPFQEEYTKPL